MGNDGREFGEVVYGAVWRTLTEAERHAAYVYLEGCFGEPWMTAFIVCNVDITGPAARKYRNRGDGK